MIMVDISIIYDNQPEFTLFVRNSISLGLIESDFQSDYLQIKCIYYGREKIWRRLLFIT